MRLNSREPNPEAKDAKIPVDKLPRCRKDDCKGLVRPHVVWFGEGLDKEVLRQTSEELDNCDLCLVVSSGNKGSLEFMEKEGRMVVIAKWLIPDFHSLIFFSLVVFFFHVLKT